MRDIKDKERCISILEELVSSKFGVERDIFRQNRLYGNKSTAYTVLVWLLYNYLRMSTNEIREFYGKGNKQQIWYRIDGFRNMDRDSVFGITVLKKIDDIKLEYIKSL